MPTVAIIDSHAHPTAAAYYAAFDEPLADGSTVRVDSIVQRPRMRLDELLAELAGLDPGSTAIVVCHGANGGLVMPMSENTQVRGFGPDAQAVLLRFTESTRGDEAQVAGQLQMPPAELRGLRDGIRAARAKRLARVVFRACNLGDTLSDLERLRVIFGAAKACAPDLYDSYVQSPPLEPTTRSAVWRVWERRHPGAVVTRYESGRFAYHRHRLAHSFRFSVMADSWAAVEAWINENLGPNRLSPQRPFPVHSLQNGGLIFPRQPEYLQHLHEVPEAGFP